MIPFGPIPSRRLGKSLGINSIFSPKMCTYNCIYCQIGETKKICTEPTIFYEPEIIFNEVKQYLGKLTSGNFPDYLTFVANGEPTLDCNLGKSIQLLKKLNIPVAVITNASLLFDISVRKNLLSADWVSMKVDAPDNLSWQAINRPSPGLVFDQYLEGIQRFATEYHGTLCSETMLLYQMNDSKGHLKKLALLISKLKPAIAYVSVPTRPPSVRMAEGAKFDQLFEAVKIFSDHTLNVELLIDFENYNVGYTGNIYEDLLSILSVHPLREEQLKTLLCHDSADFSIVESLIRKNIIRAVKYKGEKFYIRQYYP